MPPRGWEGLQLDRRDWTLLVVVCLLSAVFLEGLIWLFG